MDQTRQDFIAELQELVEQIFADLDQLQRKQDDGAARRRLLGQLLRHAHSIKGSAAAINLDRTSRIAHELEDLCEAIIAGSVDLSENVFEALDDAVNLLSDTLVTDGSIADEGAVTGTIVRLREIRLAGSGFAKGESELLTGSLRADILQSLSDSQKHHLRQALAEGAESFLIATNFDVADFDQQVYRLNARLEELGEVVLTHPVMDPAQPDRIEFRILFLSQKGSPRLSSEFADLRITPVSNLSTSNEEIRSELPSQSKSFFIRVELGKIEALRRLVKDLATTIADAVPSKTESTPDEPVSYTQPPVAKPIREGLREIDEAITDLLLVPAGGILKRAERAGRAAARLTSKQIRFETAGTELLLDKYLSESMASPLVHLVRNAVDHGIEGASERGLLGKARQGLIRIEASREEDHIAIRVVDDGRGIDPEQVCVAAAKAGLIEAGVILDLERSVRLLFKPGFSTAGSVSTTSGRGVGLDIVETAVQRIGGVVRVVSEPGFGSTFEIRIRY